MAKIIIYRNVNEIEYDILHKTNYNILADRIAKERRGNWPNFANKLWLQGLISEISVEENEIAYLEENMTMEEINEKYDLMIFPSANIFARNYVEAIKKLTIEFRKCQIPIFVISCGVQASNNAELSNLIHDIGGTSTEFIDAIYKTGGEFSLRGYFTKEFFDRLGFPSAVVTGCPSLYQVGRYLRIDKDEVGPRQLKPVVNGQNYMFSSPFYKKIFNEYKNSVFVDQDHYGKYLYDPTFFADYNYSLKNMLKLVKNETFLGMELLSHDRIVYFADMPQWNSWLKESDFNFSFGARIHGNIMSILSGIPAVVHAWDSRTREMAEFYSIPFVDDSIVASSSLYAIYEKADYSEFNNNFQKHYDEYEDFLRRCGIVKTSMGSEKLFFDNPMLINENKKPEVANELELAKLCSKIDNCSSVLKLEEYLLTFYRRLKKNRYSMT